jgi:hypothetical protein
MHRPAVHVPVLHVIPAQQGSPVAPQVWQVSMTVPPNAQTRVAPVHIMPVQHGWP